MMCPVFSGFYNVVWHFIICDGTFLDLEVEFIWIMFELIGKSRISLEIIGTPLMFLEIIESHFSQTYTGCRRAAVGLQRGGRGDAEGRPSGGRGAAVLYIIIICIYIYIYYIYVYVHIYIHKFTTVV